MKNQLITFFLFSGLGISSLAKASELPATMPVVVEKSQNKEKKIQKKSQSAKNFLIGSEIRDYKYSEPGFVSHTGLLYGVWGDWYWGSRLGNGKTHAEFLYGSLFYSGALCDLSNNCTAYSSTTQDFITKVNTRLEYSLKESLLLFLGIGHRFLYDRGNGVGFYTRTGNWVYLPLGAGFQYRKFLLDIEYDLIVYGSFKSNLSEVSTTFTDLTHSQKGYGLVLSLGYELNELWSLQGIYESWNLDESDPVASGGSLFVEPKNNSQSVGLKLGYFF